MLGVICEDTTVEYMQGLASESKVARHGCNAKPFEIPDCYKVLISPKSVKFLVLLPYFIARYYPKSTGLGRLQEAFTDEFR